MRYTTTYIVTDSFIEQALVGHHYVGLSNLDVAMREKGYKRNPDYAPRFTEDEKYWYEHGRRDGIHKFRVIADYIPLTPEEDRNASQAS